MNITSVVPLVIRPLPSPPFFFFLLTLLPLSFLLHHRRSPSFAFAASRPASHLALLFLIFFYSYFFLVLLLGAIRLKRSHKMSIWIRAAGPNRLTETALLSLYPLMLVGLYFGRHCWKWLLKFG